MSKKIRQTGIDIIKDVPWGTHFCQFYRTKRDLIDILVPYFKAGLENNEYCMWITSKPLTENDAAKALAKALPDLDSYLKRGQIEIIPHDKWYLKNGILNSEKVSKGLLKKLDKALANGYDGLRLAGNTFWLKKKDWKSFMDYEKEVDSVIGEYNIIGLCAYSLDKCGTNEVIDVVRNHQFVLIKREDKWEITESSERKRAEDEMKRFASFPQLNPNPVLEVNSSGIIVFSNAAAVLALRKLDLRDANVFLPDDMTHILAALEQEQEVQFYREVKIKDRIFGEVLYLTPQFDSIRIYANDITERKQAEEALQHSEEYFRLLMESASDVITILEGDGTIRYESLSVKQVLGYKPEELVRTSAFDLIHPDDLSDVTNIFSHGVKNPGIVLSAQCRCKHKDGSWRFLDVIGKNLLDNPTISGIVINARDITESKQAEEAVQSERQKLINILDSMVDGVYIVDQKYNIEYVNPEIEKEYGPVNGRSCHEYFEGRKKACTWCKNQEVFEGKTIRWEWYSEKTNKTYDLVNTPLKNPDGSVSKLGIFRDISERKQAEEAVRRSQKILFELVERSPFGTYIVDSQFRIAQMNAASQSGAFRNVRPVIGRDFAEAMRILWPEPVAAEIIAVFHHTLDTGEPYYSPRFINPRHDVETIESYEWELHRMTLPDGQYGVICYYFDSTRLRETDEALRRSEERFRRIYENAATGIAITDLQGRFIQCNPAYRAIVGYTEEELRNLIFSALVHPDDLEENLIQLRRLLAGELSFFNIENRYVHKNGTPVWVQKFVSLLSDETGVPSHVIALVTDITVRKRAEEEIRRHVEELHEANRELLRFNRVMEGRELRMIELKKEINELCLQTGQPPHYPLDFEKEEA